LRLEDERPADLFGELVQLGRSLDAAPPRGRNAQLGQPGAHEGLVLREAQRVGSRVHDDPVGGKCPDVLVGDVLVIPGHHVAAGREAAQVLQRAVVADLDIVGHEGRPVVGRVGQHPQRLAERDSRLVGHSRQLPGPDHAHDGQSGPGVHERELRALPGCDVRAG
jgi:hypothetical protein